MSKCFLNLIQSGKVRPYKTTRKCPIISHLLYADDCLIFAIGSKNNLEKVMAFSSSYAVASGQEINISKSNFLVHHSTHQARRHIIQHAIGF